jgi:glucosamine 6-phosphate synthetase-like amidotransferase/phosphosugar isomerase protein
MVLGHTRWATHGDPRKNENNGPQRGKSGLYLAHNGIVGNYLDIAEKYGLTLTSECDSEVILRLAEASPHPAQGLRVALRECIGSMAVALYDEKRNVVWLARDSGRPLVVARMVNDRRLFLASTAEILIAACEKVWGDRPLRWELLVPLAENEVYALSDGKLLVQGACETRSRAELREGLTRGFLDE